MLPSALHLLTGKTHRRPQYLGSSAGRAKLRETPVPGQSGQRRHSRLHFRVASLSSLSSPMMWKAVEVELVRPSPRCIRSTLYVHDAPPSLKQSLHLWLEAGSLWLELKKRSQMPLNNQLMNIELKNNQHSSCTTRQRLYHPRVQTTLHRVQCTLARCLP